MQNELTNLRYLIAEYADAIAARRSYIESSSDYDDEVSDQLWVDIDATSAVLNKEIERLFNPWQPIETAPKGSDSILLGEPEGSVAVAYWGHPFNATNLDYAWCDESTDYAITWAMHWKRKPTAPSKE